MSQRLAKKSFSDYTISALGGQNANHVSVLDFTCRVDLKVGPNGWIYSTTDSTILRIGR